MTEYDNLSDDVLFEIASHLNIKDFNDFCKSSKQTRTICNKIWYQRLINKYGPDVINWKREYIDRLNEITNSQQYWMNKYQDEFGDTINFAERYYDKLSYKLPYDSLYKLSYYISLKNVNLIKSISEEIVNYFRTEPELISLIKLRYYNQETEFWRGRNTIKNMVKIAFQEVLKNNNNPNKVLDQQIYLNIFG